MVLILFIYLLNYNLLAFAVFKSVLFGINTLQFFI